MKLIFVRHGETTHNRDDVLQGCTDTPLTEEGLLQASRLGLFAKREGVNKVLSSPLKRAHYTALRTGEVTNVGVGVVESLREMSYGEWDGKKKSELQDLPAWKERERNKYCFVHPGACHGVKGESYRSLYERVSRFLDDLIPSLSDKDVVLLVTHMGVCRNAKKYFERCSDEEAVAFSPHNDEAYVVELKDGNVPKTSLVHF